MNEKVFDGYPPGALEHLARLVGQNTSLARRNLKSSLEEELVSLHSKFIAEYETRVSGYVHQKLGSLESIDNQLTDSIDQLLANRDRIGVAIDKSSSATSELAERERKLEVLTKFKRLFVVDQEAADRALESGDLSKLLSFVSDMERTRSNCQVLLRSVSDANIAVESLNLSVAILEKVYERVYMRICKWETGSMSRDLLRRSLVLLQERSHLFHGALTAVCQGRCDSNSSEFLHVLTNADGGLELSAFDSVKFLSDMLSWVLDCSLSEKDFLDYVLENVRASTWTTGQIKPKLEYLDLSLAGVVELVESRFTSVVKSSFAILDLFKLSRVLSFYSAKLRFVAGQATKDALSSMHHSAWSSFMFQWETRAQNERSTLLLTRSGLTPLPLVNETIYLLDSILAIYADSVEDKDEGEGDGIFSVLSAGIDPLIQTCVQVANNSGMTLVESAVFLLNCFATLQGPLRRHAFAAETVKVLAGLMDMQMDSLVLETRRIVLEKTGLDQQLEHPLAVGSSLKSFYSLLFTQGIAAASHADSLISRELRAEARNAIGKSISDAYEEIYAATAGLGVATHTPEQVRALLDV